MIRTGHPLIFTPISPNTEYSADPDRLTTNGSHQPYCDWPRGASLHEHGPLCESSMAYIEYLPDPLGDIHEVAISRVASYLVGTYDSAITREHLNSSSVIRFGIDLPDGSDALEAAEAGLCLTSGQARQLAAVLVDQADRLDGIRP